MKIVLHVMYISGIKLTLLLQYVIFLLKNESDVIPKIIHQMWIGPRQRPTQLMNTWKELNPTWIYMFWDEQGLASNFPQGLRNQKQFDDMEELCGRCDIARVEILNRFGGFFIDADSICLNPLDDFFVRNDSFTCYENEFERGNLLACGYLASSPGNELMQLLLDAIGRIDVAEILSTPSESPFDTSRQAWRITGSELLTSTVFNNKYSAISIYPSFYFIPKHYTGREYKGMSLSYGTQLWGSTVGSDFYGYRLDKVDVKL